MSELGRLKKVDLRNIWQSEAQDFTPWLARPENLLLLGETLAMDLELEAVERNVGPFRADILCKDTLNDSWVLIENQLERTDHTHLGQLITYAAGLDAVTIVWIAAKVAEEHRAACDWLNQITSENVRFFALEVELWCIGDSPAAPKFNVVSKPNAWSQTTAVAKKTLEAGDLTTAKADLRDYWEAFETYLASLKSPVRPVKPLPQSWIVHSIGKTGVTLNASINRRENWVRAELYLTGKSAKDYFQWLSTDRDKIEQDLGKELIWYDAANSDRKIHLEQRFENVTDRASWPEQHRWLANSLTELNRVFRDRVRLLDPDTAGLI